jgi:hypothetical protein
MVMDIKETCWIGAAGENNAKIQERYAKTQLHIVHRHFL